MKQMISKSLLAGLLISIGGTAYLACDNRYVGAALFAVGLLAICYLGYDLYTGKVCYAKPNRYGITYLATVLAGNLIAVTVCGMVAHYVMPELVSKANQITAGKLAQPLWSVLVRAIGCGVLIYVAVEVWKRHQSMLGVLIAVPTFILCGFNHCIADCFYFAVSDDVGAAGVLYIVTVVLGNSIGGLIHYILSRESD